MSPLANRNFVWPGWLVPRRQMLLGLLLIALFTAPACQSGSDDVVLPTAPPSAPPSHSIGAGHLSGEKTTVVKLGYQRLGKEVWVSWVLTGPASASAKFSLRIESEDGRSTQTTAVGPIDKRNIGEGTHSGLAMHVDKPGKYRVTFKQVVHPQEAPGYSVEYDVRTEP